MKIRQNIRHFAAKKALTMPIIGDIAKTRGSSCQYFWEESRP